MNSLSNIAQTYAKPQEPMSIIEFVTSKNGLATKIFPSQRVILKLLNKERLTDFPVDVEVRDRFNKHVVGVYSEIGFYNYLYESGRINMSLEDFYASNDTIQVLLCCGRRASKSVMVCLYSAYRLYRVLLLDNVHEYFNIIDNEEIGIQIMCLGERSSQAMFKKFYNIIKGGKFFKKHLLEVPSSNFLKIWTNRDLLALQDKKKDKTRQSNSMVVSASPNTSQVRGQGYFTVIMEEAAHYHDSKKSSREKPLDVQLHEALMPALSAFNHPSGEPFGQMFLISSPCGKRGKFYEEFLSSFKNGKSSGCLSIQAATWELNPSISSVYLEKAYLSNPNSYSQEFGGEFTENWGQTYIQQYGHYYTCIDTRLNPKKLHGERDRAYFLGIDFGLSNDGTAFAICHHEQNYQGESEFWPQEVQTFMPEAYTPEFIEKYPKDKFVIDYTEVWYPPKGGVLFIEEILDRLEKICKYWSIQYGMYDQWSGQVIKQSIEKRGIPKIEMINHNEQLNDSLYKLFNQLMLGGRLKLPNDQTLHDEILALQEIKRQNNIIKVEAPAGANHHDDRFVSICRSLFLANCYLSQTKSLNGIDLTSMYSYIGKGGTIYTPNMHKSAKSQEKMRQRMHKTENLRNPNANRRGMR